MGDDGLEALEYERLRGLGTIRVGSDEIGWDRVGSDEIGWDRMEYWCFCIAN